LRRTSKNAKSGDPTIEMLKTIDKIKKDKQVWNTRIVPSVVKYDIIISQVKVPATRARSIVPCFLSQMYEMLLEHNEKKKTAL